MRLKKVINNPYFREDGSRIYLCADPTEEARAYYAEMMKEEKDRYRR